MSFDLWLIDLPAGTVAAVKALRELTIASLAHHVGERSTQACGGVFVAIGIALPLRS